MYDDRAPLSLRETYRAVVDVCQEFARRGGATVVPHGDERCVAAVRMDWGMGNRQVEKITVDYPGYSANVKTSHEKWMSARFFDARSRQEVHAIDAFLRSDSGGFKEGTATALCAATFAEFPVVGTHHYDSPTKPDGVVVPKD